MFILVNLLFIWLLLTQILMINKLFTINHKILLESRNLKLFYHGSFWNLERDPGFSATYFSMSKQVLSGFLESPRKIEKLVECSRKDDFFIFSI